MESTATFECIPQGRMEGLELPNRLAPHLQEDEGPWLPVHRQGRWPKGEKPNEETHFGPDLVIFDRGPRHFAVCRAAGQLVLTSMSCVDF